jgi:hypothetical protein
VLGPLSQSTERIASSPFVGLLAALLVSLLMDSENIRGSSYVNTKSFVLRKLRSMN